jgi:S1-C subfamily serine protease
MKKAPLYSSRSPRGPAGRASSDSAAADGGPALATARSTDTETHARTGPRSGMRPSPDDLAPSAAHLATAAAGTAALPRGRTRRLRAWVARHERWWWATALLGVLAVVMFGGRLQAGPPPLSAKQIDALVRQSLEEKPLPSQAAKAYDSIRGSVVRVVGLMTEGDEGDDAPAAGAPGAGNHNGNGNGNGNGAERPTDKAHADRNVERGVGTGVVIVDNGTILTNLHVVQGARRIKVTFADGHTSDARVINIQPENDLAVLRARSIPDDLEAATMRSTADLLPGDEVLAVGFPFGIGPSVSAGVVSGLKREFISPDGQQKLTNLIQFDAAANPGNSGGPLITHDGAVVGIVTAILNPSRQRTFIGIGFAVPIENAAAGAGMPPF